MDKRVKTEIYDRYDEEIIDKGQENVGIAEKLVLAARILGGEGHSENLAGQITARSKDSSDNYHTLRIGPAFSEVTLEDLCLVDDDLNVIDSNHEVNPALRFHLWLYRARPEINCVVHTHPPYTSALSMTGQPLIVSHMDTAMFHDDCSFLREWPGVPFGDEEGRIISEAIGTKRCILLAHHGFVTTGVTVEEAIYLAVFLERAARMQLIAQSAGEIRPVNPDHAEEAHDFLLKPGVVNATFNAWARKHGNG